MIRPPHNVDPGLAPGGLFFRTYDDAGRVLLEMAEPAGRDPRRPARAEAWTAAAFEAGAVALCCYDGDSGELEVVATRDGMVYARPHAFPAVLDALERSWPHA